MRQKRDVVLGIDSDTQETKRKETLRDAPHMPQIQTALEAFGGVGIGKTLKEERQ